MKVFVSGCFDLLHSGHIRFFEEASQYGDLYVSIGSDKTIKDLKGKAPFYPQQERLFMVQSLRYVKEAFIASGSGLLDFLPELEKIKPDIFFVNQDGDCELKRTYMTQHNIQYIVSERKPHENLPSRSSSDLKNGSVTTNG